MFCDDSLTAVRLSCMYLLYIHNLLYFIAAGFGPGRKIAQSTRLTGHRLKHLTDFHFQHIPETRALHSVSRIPSSNFYLLFSLRDHLFSASVFCPLTSVFCPQSSDTYLSTVAPRDEGGTPETAFPTTVSSIPHRVSRIEHPASSIQYRAASIQLPTYRSICLIP